MNITKQELDQKALEIAQEMYRRSVNGSHSGSKQHTTLKIGLLSVKLFVSAFWEENYKFYEWSAEYWLDDFTSVNYEGNGEW